MFAKNDDHKRNIIWRSVMCRPELTESDQRCDHSDCSVFSGSYVHDESAGRNVEL